MALGRTALLSIALVTAGCGSEDEVPARVVAAPVVTASHGGTLVALPRHRVELVAHRSGEVFGYVRRADGQPLTAPESALLTVTLTLDADHVRPVLLRWNAEAARYEARLRDAPVEGPADVSLMVSGRPERGSVDRLPVGEPLTESGVAYAEEPEPEEAEEEDEDEDEDEAEGEGGGRGGSLRARARRLFGI